MSEYDECLKIHPQHFDNVNYGRKTFEIRDATDRRFDVGNRVLLREYDPVKSEYTGRVEHVRITYVTTYQQKKGYVVFGFVLMPL